MLAQFFAQWASAIGAAMVLGAYVALQVGWLKPERSAFNLLNASGSLFLGICAVIDRRWGFIVLETVWTIVSVAAFVRERRRGGSHEQ